MITESSLNESEFFEGGSKRGAGKKKDNNNVKADQERAAQQVKGLFHNEDILGHSHLKKVGDEMQKHGSKEKTGFMQKENDFSTEIKKVQDAHTGACMKLLKVSIGVLSLEFIFSVFCIFYF